jgi:hypothetical protein
MAPVGPRAGGGGREQVGGPGVVIAFMLLEVAVLVSLGALYGPLLGRYADRLLPG